MRILHVIASVNPAAGGPVEGLKQIESVVVSQGNEVEVACLDDPASPWLKDFPLPVIPLGPGKGAYMYSPRLVPWLKENASRFDAVIVNGIWQYNCFGAWRALAKCSVPYFVFTHGMLDPWFNETYPLKRLKKNLYWRWGVYAALRDAKAVFFTCEEEKILARRSFRPYKVNEVVVKYGTPGPTGDLPTLRAKFLEQFPELRDKRLLLYLSRIHVKKGCDLLVEAFGKVSGIDDKSVLVMAGPDQTNLIPSLKRQAAQLGIEDRIVWPGMLTGDQKWGAFAAAEAFVLPSHQENFGIVVAEALACGTPVVISNKVNIWREIEAAGGGIVDEDTQEGTDRALGKWMALTEEGRCTMRERARACFEQNFEIREAAASLLAAIRTHGNVQ